MGRGEKTLFGVEKGEKTRQGKECGSFSHWEKVAEGRMWVGWVERRSRPRAFDPHP